MGLSMCEQPAPISLFPAISFDTLIEDGFLSLVCPQLMMAAAVSDNYSCSLIVCFSSSLSYFCGIIVR